MIDLDIKITGDISADLEKYNTFVKGTVIHSGAAAMARVLYEEVKLNASPPRMGRKTGNLQKSIYRTYAPERSPEGVKTYIIGARYRDAPHHHLLEFGTSRMAAKPFLRPALDHMSAAIKAGNERMRERLAVAQLVEDATNL